MMNMTVFDSLDTLARAMAMILKNQELLMKHLGVQRDDHWYSNSWNIDKMIDELYRIE